MRLSLCLAILGSLLFASEVVAQPDSSATTLPRVVGPSDYLVRDGAESWPVQLELTGGRASIQARVEVAVEIDERGGVLKTTVVRDHGDLLNQIALDTVDRLEFRPSMREGVPVRGTLVVPVYFCWGPCPADPIE